MCKSPWLVIRYLASWSVGGLVGFHSNAGDQVRIRVIPVKFKMGAMGMKSWAGV